MNGAALKILISIIILFYNLICHSSDNKNESRVIYFDDIIKNISPSKNIQSPDYDPKINQDFQNLEIKNNMTKITIDVTKKDISTVYNVSDLISSWKGTVMFKDEMLIRYNEFINNDKS